MVRRLVVSGLLVVAIAGALVGLHVGQNFQDTLFNRALYNFGHVPLFGALALALFALSLNLLGPGVGRWTHYSLALFGALALAAVSEALQLPGPRDADLGDFGRDLVGAVGALGFLASFDRKLDSPHRMPRLTRLAIRFSAVVAVASAIAPVALSAEAYRQRPLRLPVLCGFQSYWETVFLKTRDARIRYVPAPSAWDKPAGDRVGRMTFLAGGTAVLYFREPHPDWTGYSMFAFDLFSELDAPVQLHFRIHDRRHDRTYEDRFNRRLELSPGLNRIRIPLDEVREGPVERELDMTAIHGITLFAHRSPEPFTVYIDDFRLE